LFQLWQQPVNKSQHRRARLWYAGLVFEKGAERPALAPIVIWMARAQPWHALRRWQTML